MLVVGGMAIGNADNLQTVEFDLFVDKNVNAGLGDSAEVLGVVAELLVISGDEEGAEWRPQLTQRLGGARGVDGGAVVEVAGDKDGVGAVAHYQGRNAAKKAAVAHVAEMQIADESGFAADPGTREVFEANADVLDARPASVDHGCQGKRGCASKQGFDDAVRIDGQMCDGSHA